MTTNFDTVDDTGSEFDADILGSDDFLELDTLLKASVKEANRAAVIKESRKAIAHGGLTPEERTAAEARVREWESKREWDSVAAVTIFSTQVCDRCGSRHSHYQGIFQKQQHRTSTTVRWIRSNDQANHGLPREIKHDDETVAQCIHCLKW